MVITKRYNSVERFTSMQLSDDGGGGEESMASQQQQRQQPSQMLAIPTWIDKQRPSEQQQPTPTGQQHISLMRRSSQEQLLQKPPVPSSPSSASHSLTLVPQQQPPSVAYGPSSSFQYQPQRQHQHPMMAHPLQPQQQLFARQYVQPTAAGQQHPPSHSIMRPASGGTNYAGPYAPVPTPAQSRQSFAPPANYYRPATQQPAESRSFLARKVPAPIWLSLSALQIVVGIVSVFIGALNASAYNCIIEPNIPIYLIISGVLLIVNGSVRSFFWLAGPSSSPSPQRQVDQQAKDGGGIPNKHMAEYALEGIVLFGMAILIILGCIWVYGASRYMQSQRYMFEWHYCNPTVYWTAWWSVTLHLGFFALLILGAIFLLLFGALGT